MPVGAPGNCSGRALWVTFDSLRIEICVRDPLSTCVGAHVGPDGRLSRHRSVARLGTLEAARRTPTNIANPDAQLCRHHMLLPSASFGTNFPSQTPHATSDFFCLVIALPLRRYATRCYAPGMLEPPISNEHNCVIANMMLHQMGHF
jgi:hypothetical protein